MNSTFKGAFTIEDIQDNEDGSATVTLDMDQDTYHNIFEYGFIQLIKKGIEADDRQSMASGS